MKFKNTSIVLISLVGLLSSCSNHTASTNLSVEAFEKGIAQSNIQVLDVRTPREYESGHLKNAFLADWNNQDEFKTRVAALDKSKPVYTYCLSGGRSNAATNWLIENGYTAYNLAGGTIAWKGAGKTMEQEAFVQQISLAEYMAGIPADKTVLVDFSAVWCPPCKVMEPVLDSLVKSNGAQFLLVKIDGGNQVDICHELKVNQFPTFVIYKQGKEIWRKQGIVDAKELVANF